MRKPFLEAQEFGALLYAGVMDQLSLAGKERLKRLEAMAEKAAATVSPKRSPASVRSRREFHEHLKSVMGVFREQVHSDATERCREAFLRDFQKAAGNDRVNYIATIQGLPAKVSSNGVRWLGSLVDDHCARAATALPSMNLFKNQQRIT